jgi:hypothetical protein
MKESLRTLSLPVMILLQCMFAFAPQKASAQSIAPVPIFSAMLFKAGGTIAQVESNPAKTIQLLILSGNEQKNIIDSLNAFRAKGGKIGSKDFNAVALDSADKALDGSILVVTSGNDSKVDSITKICNAKTGSKLICISANPEYVKKGIPLGIGLDGTPKIFVNKSSAISNKYGIATIMGLKGSVVEY